MQAYFSFYQQLKAKNNFWAVQDLKVRKKLVNYFLSDNAVKETNLKLDVEQLGGFSFLEADNLEEAKTIVAKHPGLKIGAFEIKVVDEEITEMVGAK